MAQVEDRLVQLAGQLQRVPGSVPLELHLIPGRPLNGQFGGSFFLVYFQGNVFPQQRRQLDPVASRTVGAPGELERAALHEFGELLRLGAVVDQLPFLRAVGAHAFGGGAEDIGEVAAHFALVDDPRQAAGPWQHAQQRNLGQAHGRGAVVDHRDLVAGQRQLVAAAGGGAVQRGEELEARVVAGVLQAIAGLVGELAEVDLHAWVDRPSM